MHQLESHLCQIVWYLKQPVLFVVQGIGPVRAGEILKLREDTPEPLKQVGIESHLPTCGKFVLQKKQSILTADLNDIFFS